MNPTWYEIPVFYFSNVDSLVLDQSEVHAPLGCQELDYELELGCVIGKAGKNIDPQRAMDHVLGFTIVNDFSARDLQRREMSVGLGPAKGKDFATAVGPTIIPTSQLRERLSEDGKLDLEMVARVNGKELSRGNAKTMFHSWPDIIAFASQDAELKPGDLLGSGTVGTGCILELGPENSGGWLKPGDTIELEIEEIGILKNRIIERPPNQTVTK